MKKKTISIKGMHCKSCEVLLEEKIKDISNVEKVEASQKRGTVDIYYKKSNLNTDEVYKIVEDIGYKIGTNNNLILFSKNKEDYIYLLKGVIILFFLYILFEFLDLFNVNFNPENLSFLTIFIMGVVASVSTCMVLVGGLVLGISSRYSELHPEMTPKQKIIPHLYFNLGRVLGFGFLGGLLAFGGSALQLSGKFFGIVTLIVGLVMIILGLKLVKIFPFIEKINITLPKNISNFLGIAKKQKKYSHNNSFVSGVLTFFLPCGFTQAVQLYAVSSGSFITGALIMSVFAIGTIPGLLGIGGFSSFLKGKKSKLFFATAGLAVIIFGWFNFLNGSKLLTQESVYRSEIEQTKTENSETIEVQEIKMTQSASGYFPNEIIIEKGKKVRWIITSTTQFSCASSISVPKYNINRNLKLGENIIEFTPMEVGTIPFTCVMGMHNGRFVVVEGD